MFIIPFKKLSYKLLQCVYILGGHPEYVKGLNVTWHLGSSAIIGNAD